MFERRFEPQENSERMRRTSEVAFNQIKKEGLLSRMRFVVYEFLFHNGPVTGAELDEALRGAKGGRGHYHKRLCELRDLGVVAEVGQRGCRITGRFATVWDVTPDLPVDLPSKPKKPSVKHLREALYDARRCWSRYEKEGTALSSGFVLTMQWLASMVPPRCQTCKGTGQIKGDGFIDSCPDCKGEE